MIFEKLKSFQSQVLKDNGKPRILTNKIMCICSKMVLESWYKLCRPLRMRCKLFRWLVGCFEYWCNILESLVGVSPDSIQFLTRVSHFLILFLLGLSLDGGSIQESAGLCFSEADHRIQLCSENRVIVEICCMLNIEKLPYPGSCKRQKILYVESCFVADMTILHLYGLFGSLRGTMNEALMYLQGVATMRLSAIAFCRKRSNSVVRLLSIWLSRTDMGLGACFQFYRKIVW